MLEAGLYSNPLFPGPLLPYSSQASTLCVVSGFLLVKGMPCCLLTMHLEVCASRPMDLLHSLRLLWAGRNGLPPTPDTLHLGCSYRLHSSYHFVSTCGAALLKKINKNK